MNQAIAGVRVVSWNPRQPLVGRRLHLGGRIQNFGDLLGPLLVDRIVHRSGIPNRRTRPRQSLLTIGSILHFAQSGDVIWGSGVNGKISSDQHQFTNLDVRAVRGPLTRDFLLERGISCPSVYGDPALLVGTLFPELLEATKKKKRERLIVPNLHDFPDVRLAYGEIVLNPCSGLDSCLSAIASSELVVGSSLHGVIVAEALGIPAKLVASSTEAPFKYQDYFLGSGRSSVACYGTVDEALDPQSPALPAPTFDVQRLTEAFPWDLWND